MIATTPPVLSDHELHQLLVEDAPFGDLTTDSLGIAGQRGGVTFLARDPMTVCGVEEAARLFELCGARTELKVTSGTKATPDTLLLYAEGSAGALHRAWKTAQTLMEWCGGIASSAAAIVAAARRGHAEAIVAGTRKNVPGNRRLAVKGFQAGGAVMHRNGLSDTLLIFAQHRRLLRDEPAAETLARLRRLCPEKKIVVEVATPDEALVWADADVLQLEKFPPAQVAATVAALAERGSGAVVGAAGGINAKNAKAYALAGARLLVTSAPHWAPPRDVQVRFLI